MNNQEMQIQDDYTIEGTICFSLLTVLNTIDVILKDSIITFFDIILKCGVYPALGTMVAYFTKKLLDKYFTKNGKSTRVR